MLSGNYDPATDTLPLNGVRLLYTYKDNGELDLEADQQEAEVNVTLAVDEEGFIVVTETDDPSLEGMRFEDFPWWSEVLLHVGRCAILNLPLYYYYPNPKSYLLSSDSKQQAHHLAQSIEAAKRAYEDAPAEKKRLWESRFLTPFLHYLEKKNRQGT